MVAVKCNNGFKLGNGNVFHLSSDSSFPFLFRSVFISYYPMTQCLRSYRFNIACVKNDYDHFSAGFCCSVLLAWLHLLKKVKCFDLGGFCLEFIVLCSIFVQHRTVKAVISSPSVDNHSPFKKRCFHLQFLHIAPLMCINITEILTYWSI